MYDDDMRLDFPRFFPFVGELLAHVLITVWESQGPKQKEVVKAISNSIREVTGNDLQELKDCVIKTVKIHVTIYWSIVISEFNLTLFLTGTFARSR